MRFVQISSLDELTPQVIVSLIESHKIYDLPRFKKLQDYYEGRHDILKRVLADPSKPNNRLVTNFPKQIVTTMAGYFLGKPVSYTGDNTDFLTKLQYVFDSNDEQEINLRHAKQAGIKGMSAELLWLDEAAEIRISHIDVNQLIPLFDYSIDPQLIAAIRYYVQKDLVTYRDTLKVELYTAKEVVYYEMSDISGTLTEVNRKPHGFDDVPIVIYWNNDEAMSDFEDVIPLIDAYNLAQSDTANDHEYAADSHLVLTGVEFNDQTAAEMADMKNKRLIFLPEGGKAEWLMKKSDHQTIEAYKKRLREDIFSSAGVPDLENEAFSSNISGVALRFRFFKMEQIVANKERTFKQSLQRRIKLIAQNLEKRRLATRYDFTSVKITFVRNLPQNLTELADVANKLSGLVSQETLLALMPFVDDPAKEVARFHAQLDHAVGATDQSAHAASYANLGANLGADQANAPVQEQQQPQWGV